jgi:hypothetical protein
VVRSGGEAVVMSSDSRATAGLVAYEVRKIYPIIFKAEGKEVPLAIAGGAGEAAAIKQSYRLCEKILTELALKEWKERTPTFEQFEDAVYQVESALVKRFRELREQGLKPDFSMILASISPQGRASMYVFDSNGLAEPVHDNPGFALIGTGFVTGGNLLLRLLGYSAEESYTLDLGVLSAFIIDVVSEVDPAVGPFVGESYFMRVENGEVRLGPLKIEALKEYKQKIPIRRDILQKIWRLLDIVGEEEIIKIIEELERRITGAENKH